MKRLLIIMLLLVAIGIVNAASVTIHADTYVKISYKRACDNDYTIGQGDNYFLVSSPYELGLYNIKIQWMDTDSGLWNVSYDSVSVWWVGSDIHLYYRFVTIVDPTNPINQ